MKKLFLFILILTSIQVNGQITKVGEGQVSPDGNFVAFICYMGHVQDIFLYDLQKDTLSQITNSSMLDFDSQYKTSLNWIDNQRILFLSKYGGLSQQYIVNVFTKTMEPNGTSSSNEYLLEYSSVNQESYYISSHKGMEPAVFSRKLHDLRERKVSKGNMNCTSITVSPNGELLTYKEMPFGKTVLVSLRDNKIIKTKMPMKNTFVYAWSPSSDRFIYRYTYFTGETSESELRLYNILTKTSETIMKDCDFVWGCLWTPSKDKYIYCLSNKCCLVDQETGKQKEYDVIGRPVCWLNNGQSVLFIQDKKAFIQDLFTGRVKSVVN